MPETKDRLIGTPTITENPESRTITVDPNFRMTAPKAEEFLAIPTRRIYQWRDRGKLRVMDTRNG